MYTPKIRKLAENVSTSTNAAGSTSGNTPASTVGNYPAQHPSPFMAPRPGSLPIVQPVQPLGVPALHSSPMGAPQTASTASTKAAGFNRYLQSVYR